MGYHRTFHHRIDGRGLYQTPRVDLVVGGQLIALGLALSLASPALAEVQAHELPAAFSVTGVDRADMLNIRNEPSAQSDIIGELAPSRVNVEVIALSPDGQWGMVSSGEGNGWVNLRFLAKQDSGPADEAPRPLRCSGTEPFWTVTNTFDGDRYSTPEGEIDLTWESDVVTASGFASTYSDAEGGDWTMIVQPRACSDGMSDRLYGWQAMVLRVGGGANEIMNGCCTLDDGGVTPD